MKSEMLIAASLEFAKKNNISNPVIIRIMKDVIGAFIVQRYGEGAKSSVIINLEKGDVEVARLRTVVLDEDPRVELPAYIALSEAQKIEEDFEVDEEVYEKIDLGSFTRREVFQMLSSLKQKIRLVDQDRVYEKYKKLVGKLIYPEVYYITPREVTLYDEDRNKLYLPREEQIPRERYTKGAPLCVIVHKVQYEFQQLKVILSRASNEFLTCLLHKEIPEIESGLVSIKKVVRRVGVRAKVAVATEDDRIDPVGACIGTGGARLHPVTNELKKGLLPHLPGEQVDIIEDSDYLPLLLRRALSPAKINRIEEEGEGEVGVYVNSDQVALTIGKGAQNIDLAGKLTGRIINVYKEVDAQFMKCVENPEHRQVLEEHGYTTIKELLSSNPAEIIERTGLPYEVVLSILEHAELLTSTN